MPPKRSTDSPQGLVVFAKSKRRVSAFYQQTLDLAVEESSTTHDLLRGHGVEIVVQAIPRKYAAGIKVTTPPVVREETPFKPAFVVHDLNVVRHRAVKTGGFLKPAEEAWSFGGTIVLDGWDPEGNVVQFRQRR